MRSSVLILVALVLACAGSAPPIPVAEGRSVLRVPGDYRTIQQAVDAAADGDVVLVAPGRYREHVAIVGKPITLGSWYLGTGRPRDVERTTLHGAVRVSDVSVGRVRIVGLTISGAETGIDVRHSSVEILHNRLLDHRREGIGLLNSRAEIRSNLMRRNGDDGIDSDGANELLIEGNDIVSNRDDGIEVRLHPYEGPTLSVTIRDNRITGSGEDGIQIIDYQGRSDRVIRIERNFFRGTQWAAIACMADGRTQEDLAGALLEEPVFVVNNTFVHNRVGLTGGDNLLALNNIFSETSQVAVRRLRGNSIAAHNLFWKNARDLDDVITGAHSADHGDPRLDGQGRLRERSPAIDAGVRAFGAGSELAVEISEEAFAGSAPDLGAYERR